RNWPALAYMRCRCEAVYVYICGELGGEGIFHRLQKATGPYGNTPQDHRLYRRERSHIVFIPCHERRPEWIRQTNTGGVFSQYDPGMICAPLFVLLLSPKTASCANLHPRHCLELYASYAFSGCSVPGTSGKMRRIGVKKNVQKTISSHTICQKV